jgi:hypothetical protein
MKSHDKKQPKTKKDITPIIDGDARPDINLEPESKKDSPSGKGTERKKFTPGRNDKDSMEDYKDAL